MTELQRKPIKYYIDFENVHGAGLKGVDMLDERDEVVIIYSQAAETFHIEHAIDILKSKARIEFVEVDGGTRNAADFQLIVALFGAMDEAFDYAIVSGDTGFDAAIKMGERMGLPSVCRLANIRGDIEVEKAEKPKSRRSRRSRPGRDSLPETEPQSQELQAEEASTTPEAQDQVQSDKQEETPSLFTTDASTKDAEQQADGPAEGQAASSKRRTRRRRRVSGLQDGQAAAQAETTQQANEALLDETAPVEHPAAKSVADVAPEGASDKAATYDAADETASAKEPAKAASEKPAKTSTRKKTPSEAREEARQDTAAARARAAEAMRLAFAELPKAAGEPIASENAELTEGAANETVPEAVPAVALEESESTSSSEGQDATALIKSLLAERGVELSEAQLATVQSALDGANGRQDFYRRIIKIERQQKGRALYRQVREHYSALIEALRNCN